MSMFKDYLKEAENKDLYETEKGFIIYYDYDDGIYFDTIYVKPEFRDSKSALMLTASFTKEFKSYDKPIYGEIIKAHTDPTSMMHLYLALGFKIFDIKQDKIIIKISSKTIKKYYKEIFGEEV